MADDLSRQFEKAVYEFITKLDPTADVYFDHKVKDRDTNSMRQVDAWIDAKIGGHLPFSVYVSCKRENRKLDATDIEEFMGAVKSTGASFGIIYSIAGFYRPAVEKAKINGHACCQLYQNRPADKPQSFILRAFACHAQIQLSIANDFAFKEQDTWNDLFGMAIGESDPPETVLEKVAELFRQEERKAISSIKKGKIFPGNWEAILELRGGNPEATLSIRVAGYWKKFQGKLEAHLLDGSYCFTNEHFSGKQVSPILDVRGEHPGPDWEEVGGDVAFPDAGLLMIRSGGDTKSALRRVLGPQTIVRSDQPTPIDHEV